MDLVKLFYGIDGEVVKSDMRALCETDKIRAGMLVCKFYFLEHMLKVKVWSRGRCSEPYVSFFEVATDIDRLCHKYPYIKKAIDYSMNRQPEKDLLFHVYDAYRLYFGHVSIFKPMIAKRLVELYRPSVVADPCCGWGGRMIGCLAGGCDRYIGFDTNVELMDSYGRMMSDLGISNKVKISCQDCLQVRYEELGYDMLLTSPPYYNTEVYVGVGYRQKEEWDMWYRQAISLWWQHLRIGGVMALSIPFSVYKIAVDICGSADDAWRLDNASRCDNKDDTELLFIWVKT